MEASFIPEKNDTHSTEREDLDLCCRSLLKCAAHKNTEFNHSYQWNIMHCECENLFRNCLKNLATSSSKQFAYIYSIHKKKCYANGSQNKRCIKFESFLLPELKFNRTIRENFHNRCIEYEVDENKPKQLQLYDLSFSSDRNVNSIGKYCLWVCFIVVQCYDQFVRNSAGLLKKLLFLVLCFFWFISLFFFYL